MKNKYEGLKDKHLNVFIPYDGSEKLENNITKAFINVLQSFDEKKLKLVVKDLFGFDLPIGEISASFFLQSKPKKEDIEKYQQRIMFAFSPTGKSWGITGIDTKDEEEIKKELKKKAEKRYPDSKEDQTVFINYELEEIMLIRKNKGSIPDGWIFIDVDDKPCIVIAMENKLYDLDPYQINNHIEKSLLITQNKPQPIYKKYEDIIKLFEKTNTFLSNQFIEYMIILGYGDVKDFSLACQADPDIRVQLVKKFGFNLLDKIHEGEKDYRNNHTVRCHVKYPYLNEINLGFSENNIELWLSFGSRQESAKRMLSNIDALDIESKGFSLYLGFHLMIKGGRIIKGSYVDQWKDLNDFVSYWKYNIKYVKTSTPSEIILLYEKMFDDGKIQKEELTIIKSKLNSISQKNKILVIPEISLVYRWGYELAGKLGLDNLTKDILDKFYLAMKEMKLK